MYFQNTDKHSEAFQAQTCRSQKASGTVNYHRATDLPRLIPATSALIHSRTTANRSAIIHLIQNALRKERLRANIKGQSYQIERHKMLIQALKAERQSQPVATSTQANRRTGKPQMPLSSKKRRPLLRDSVFKNFRSSP